MIDRLLAKRPEDRSSPPAKCPDCSRRLSRLAPAAAGAGSRARLPPPVALSNRRKGQACATALAAIVMMFALWVVMFPTMGSAHLRRVADHLRIAGRRHGRRVVARRRPGGGTEGIRQTQRSRRSIRVPGSGTACQALPFRVRTPAVVVVRPQSGDPDIAAAIAAASPRRSHQDLAVVRSRSCKRGHGARGRSGRRSAAAGDGALRRIASPSASGSMGRARIRSARIQ